MAKTLDQKEILRLREEIKKNTRNPKAPLARMLSALYREGKATQDEELLGFVCFHYADYYYFIKPDRQKFYRYLRQALQYMMACGDHALLGTSYNLLAVDAHNKGNYTIAFKYYLTALNIGKENRQAMLCAAIEANIGRILIALGNYQLADEYLASSLQRVEKTVITDKNRRHHITIAYLYATSCLFLRKRREAKKQLSKIKRLLKDEGQHALFDMRLLALYLEAQLFALREDDRSLAQCIEEMLPLMKADGALFDQMEDVFYLGETLLAHGYLAHVNKLLQAMDAAIKSCGITHLERLYYELELDYHQAAGHPRLAQADMQKINACIRLQEEEQLRSHLQAIEFSSVMSALRIRQRVTVQENKILRKEADTDALTKLPNRYAMNEHLDAAFERARRKGKKLGVGIVDVDYFKEYNDTYGHQAGDVCLQAIAGALRRLSKDKDVFCARYGGDEFVLVVENADKKKLKALSEKLDEEITSCNISHRRSAIASYVTLSQGYSLKTPTAGRKVWDYLAEADRALYTRKKAR